MLVAGPAQAAPENLNFTGKAFRIERGGVTYKVQVTAYRNPDGTTALQISIFKRKDPSGPAKGAAYEVWSRVISGFSANDNFSTGELHPTADQMEGFGNINMDWAPTDDLVKTCQGHNRSRKGRFAGNFKFKTGTDKFGTIEKGKLRGTLSSNDGDCPGNNNNNCPKEIRSFQSFGSEFFWFGGHEAGAEKAGLTAVKGEDLSNEWHLSHQIFAYLPQSNFELSDDVKTGMIKGADGTFTSGTSNYTAPGDSSDGLPQPCGDGKEYFNRSTTGTFEGNFTFNFLLGNDPKVTGEASATRLIVHDAA